MKWPFSGRARCSLTRRLRRRATPRALALQRLAVLLLVVDCIDVDLTGTRCNDDNHCNPPLVCIAEHCVVVDGGGTDADAGNSDAGADDAGTDSGVVVQPQDGGWLIVNLVTDAEAMASSDYDGDGKADLAFMFTGGARFLFNDGGTLDLGEPVVDLCTTPTRGLAIIRLADRHMRWFHVTAPNQLYQDTDQSTVNANRIASGVTRGLDVIVAVSTTEVWVWRLPGAGVVVPANAVRVGVTASLSFAVVGADRIYVGSNDGLFELVAEALPDGGTEVRPFDGGSTFDPVSFSYTKGVEAELPSNGRHALVGISSMTLHSEGVRLWRSEGGELLQTGNPRAVAWGTFRGRPTLAIATDDDYVRLFQRAAPIDGGVTFDEDRPLLMPDVTELLFADWSGDMNSDLVALQQNSRALILTE